MNRKTKPKRGRAAEFYNLGHKQRRDRAERKEKQREREWARGLLT